MLTGIAFQFTCIAIVSDRPIVGTQSVQAEDQDVGGGGRD